MSFAVHFSFSWCLSKTLIVPTGTKVHSLEHVNNVADPVSKQPDLFSYSAHETGTAQEPTPEAMP